MEQTINISSNYSPNIDRFISEICENEKMMIMENVLEFFPCNNMVPIFSYLCHKISRNIFTINILCAQREFKQHSWVHKLFLKMLGKFRTEKARSFCQPSSPATLPGTKLLTQHLLMFALRRVSQFLAVVSNIGFNSWTWRRQIKHWTITDVSCPHLCQHWKQTLAVDFWI